MAKLATLFFAISIFSTSIAMEGDGAPSLSPFHSWPDYGLTPPGTPRPQPHYNHHMQLQPQIVQQEDDRVIAFKQLFQKVQPDELITTYTNNEAYRDEIARLYVNAVRTNQEGNVVLDMRQLEHARDQAQQRHVRIENTKRNFKIGFCGVLLCGCSFTLGMKCATILMKHSTLSE